MHTKCMNIIIPARASSLQQTMANLIYFYMTLTTNWKANRLFNYFKYFKKNPQNRLWNLNFYTHIHFPAAYSTMLSSPQIKGSWQKRSRGAPSLDEIYNLSSKFSSQFDMPEKTSKGWHPGDILIRCRNHPQLAPFHMREQHLHSKVPCASPCV